MKYILRIFILFLIWIATLGGCDPGISVKYNLINDSDTTLDLLMFNVGSEVTYQKTGKYENLDSLSEEIGSKETMTILDDGLKERSLSSEALAYGLSKVFDSVQVYRGRVLVATHTNNPNEWEKIEIRKGSYKVELHLQGEKNK